MLKTLQKQRLGNEKFNELKNKIENNKSIKDLDKDFNCDNMGYINEEKEGID